MVACVSLPEKGERLKTVLSSEDVIRLPLDIQRNGLLLVQGVEIENQKLDFIVDTGATRSAVFEGIFKKRLTKTKLDEDVTLHGMTQVEKRKTVRFDRLKLGSTEFLSQKLVILPDREVEPHNSFVSKRYDGLLGMDILKNYSLHISRKTKSLNLIPKEKQVNIPPVWHEIKLTSNPYKAEDRNLHFFDVELSGSNAVSLLDTGSELSILNWDEENFPKLQPLYNNQLQQWKYEGAVGVFKPSIKIKVGTMSAGDIAWQDEVLFSTKLDSLKILGVEEKPFLIAGMNLLQFEEVLIDFERNRLGVRPVWDFGRGSGLFKNTYDIQN